MENKNVIIKSILDEIIQTSATEGNIFNEYKSRETIGKEVFKELYKRFDFEKKGFIMSDVSRDVGLLSQCQSLQALVSLALDFGLSFDDNIVENQKVSIRDMMDIVIEEVITRITRTDENGDFVGYVFDASPYDTTHYTAEHSSIDTITWVIPSFFIILKYYANLETPEVCKWEDKIIPIIRHGIKYINKAYVNGKKTDEGMSIGWNFTKDCEEPSLYFSFAVSECYLDMFNTFESILKYPYAMKNSREYGIPIDEDLRKDYEKKLKEYNANRNRKVVNENHAKHDTYNELVRIYKLVNEIDELDEIRIDHTIYGDLENRCRAVAIQVWEHVKDNLADQFFYNDLNTTLSEKDILMSTTSDALFNTVFIINIMIDGGLDEYLGFLKNAAILAGDENNAEKYQREYGSLLESCQLAVQKAFRTYEYLKNNSKDYIVDQYLIGFNEKFTKHKNLVNELRKLRMKSFSLLPMLIHTNNVISEYLIKYPQYNMRKYLEYILENRYFSLENNEVHWIWEKDGFFSGSNCYYIVALNEFYNYHEKYERDYINIGRKNEEYKKRIINEYITKQRSPGGVIAELEKKNREQKEKLEEKTKEIENLERRIKEVKKPVEDAVRVIINEELESKFAILLKNTLSCAARALTLDEIDDTPDKDKVYSGICSSFYDMILANIFAGYYKVGNSFRFSSAEDYQKKAKEFSDDLKASIAAYISSINSYVGTNDDAEKRSSLRIWLEDEKKK